MSLAPDRSLLPRVLEPEVMDSADEARDYDAMDHAEVNRRFVDDFLAAARTAGLPPEIHVLDLGTGTAQIPIELCRRESHARVVGVDLAESMLHLGRQNVAKRGLSDRIVLERADAKRSAYSAGQFTAVMSNSIVHHIPDPARVLTEAWRVLRPGGLMFIRDLARPRDNRQVAHLVEVYAAGSNAVQRQLFEASLRAALAVGEIRELVASLGFTPGTVAASSDRHWTWTAIKC
jgi:ubiquinone/menaquinone biosynthesis C-methylase UbiE